MVVQLTLRGGGGIWAWRRDYYYHLLLLHVLQIVDHVSNMRRAGGRRLDDTRAKDPLQIHPTVIHRDGASDCFLAQSGRRRLLPLTCIVSMVRNLLLRTAQGVPIERLLHISNLLVQELLVAAVNRVSIDLDLDGALLTLLFLG